MGKKGQASIELILLVTVAMFLLAGFITIQFIQTRDIMNSQKKIGAEDIANKIKIEVSLAGRIDPDYDREFELPESLNGVEYYLLFGTKEVSIEVDIAGQRSSHPKILAWEISSVNSQSWKKPFELNIGKDLSPDGQPGNFVRIDGKKIRIYKEVTNDIRIEEL